MRVDGLLRDCRIALLALCLLLVALVAFAKPVGAYADEAPAEVEVEIGVVEDIDDVESGIPVEHVHVLSVQSDDPALQEQVEAELSAYAEPDAASYRDGLYDLMKEAFENHATALDTAKLRSLEIPVNAELSATIAEVRRAVIEDNPDMFWVSTAESFSYRYTARQYLMSLTFTSTYSISADEAAAMQSDFNAAIADVQSWIDASGASTDAERCKVVHDWLVRNCSYNKEALVKGGPTNYGSINPWTAYGALVDKAPVCQGYSYAFKVMMNELGIPCECIIETESNGTLHMWNRVRIGGNWYNVDVTHDDPLKAGTSSDFGYDAVPRTTFFLKSDDYFHSTADSSAGIAYHTSFEPANPGTDSSYDSRSWSAYGASGPVMSRDIGDATVTVADQTYTGKALTPAPKVVLASTTLKKGTDYTVTYAKNTNAGMASVTVKGAGEYTGSKTTTFKIAPASITGATVTGIAAKAYTGSAIKQKPTVKMGTLALVSGTDYSVSYKNNKAAGTATCTITGAGNYTGSISKNFTISKVNIATNQDVVVSNIGDKTYTGKAQKPGVTVKLGLVNLANGTDYTVSYANNTKAGTATVTVTGKGSCTGTVTKKFRIAPFNLKKAKISGISNKKYTGKAITQKVVVKIGGTKLKKGVDYTVSYKKNKKVGTASVIIKGKGSCTGAVTKKFKIKKK